MNGLDYEKYCFDWLKKQGYRNIQLTRASGDQGIDILACRNRKKYGFQCKYYQKPVGNEAVQQAYSGCAYYHCDLGGVITNNSFTRSAIALAEETGILLYEKVEPSGIRIIPSFYRILSFVSMALSIFTLYHTALTDLELLTGITLFSAGLSGLFYAHFSACVISVMLSLIACILCFVQSLTAIAVYFVFYFLFQLIRLIQFQKQRSLSTHQKIQEELQQEIANSTSEIGKHLEILLTDELHCSVRLKEANHVSEEILEFTFHANKNIRDDIPLAQYALNQYARYEGLKDQYELESIDQRTLLLRLKKCSCH